MSVNQALSAALAGVNATQQALSVVAGNVANANTTGYVEEGVNQVETAVDGQTGTSVDISGINRNLNTLLQSQLRTETSGRRLRGYGRAALSTTPADLRHAGIVIFLRRYLQQLHECAANAVDQSELVFGAERGHQRRASSGAKSKFDDRQRPTAARPSRSWHSERGTNRQHRDTADRPNQSAACSGAARQFHGDARGPARPGHYAARANDEYHGNAGHRQPNIGIYRVPASNLWPARKRRSFPSVMSERCRRLRNGAPIRARTAPAPSRSRRLAARRPI